jgi:excinuclease ABC subunit A
LIDLGPGGGREGGELLYAGTRPGIETEARSLTGAALRRWREADATKEIAG